MNALGSQVGRVCVWVEGRWHVEGKRGEGNGDKGLMCRPLCALKLPGQSFLPSFVLSMTKIPYKFMCFHFSSDCDARFDFNSFVAQLFHYD